MLFALRRTIRDADNDVGQIPVGFVEALAHHVEPYEKLGCKTGRTKDNAPVVSTTFLPPNLALELPSSFLHNPLTILLDLFCGLDHPLVCESMFVCSHRAIANAF